MPWLTVIFFIQEHSCVPFHRDNILIIATNLISLIAIITIAGHFFSSPLLILYLDQYMILLIHQHWFVSYFMVDLHCVLACTDFYHNHLSHKDVDDDHHSLLSKPPVDSYL